MNARHDKTPEQIEAEIEHTRAEMSETIDAIQRKLSPGQLLDQAMHYVQSGPGDFASNLGATIKNNPVPVTLIGLGLAWLMMARSNGSSIRDDEAADVDSGHPVGTGYGYTSGTAGAAVGSYEAAGGVYEPGWVQSAETDEAIREKAGKARDAMAERAGTAGERVAEGARHARDRTGQMAHDARRKVAEMSGGPRDRMSRATSGTQEQVGHFGGGVRNQAGRLGDAARGQAERAGNGFRYLIEEQPLVLAGIGLAVGAALGAVLPATRREDEWMGETRDELLEAAKKEGRAQIDKADRVLGAAEQAAKEEADKQGITPEAAQQQAREAKEKVEKVASAARDAAKEEATKQEPSLRGTSDKPTT